MKFRNISRSLSPFLSLALLLGGFVRPSHGQDRVIVINADQPNVWTLEQAHYLLAQMHRRNLDLKAKRLEELDPNEIAGLRFDVMKMLIEFGATFNQAELASNRMFSRNQEFNTRRRDELIAERDRLRRQSLTLTGEIDELEAKKADAESEEEKASLEAKIASKKNRLAKVDKEIENINEELKTLNVSAGELKATTGGATFDPDKLPDSVFDNAFEDAATAQIEKFNEAPKLNASLRLENFLQMQYEIIAKQLTLLRDEVGPGERLLFLELPQTVNVAHHESNKKWAQSWWKIAGYTVRCPDQKDYAKIEESQIPAPCKEGMTEDQKQKLRQTQEPELLLTQSPNQKPITTSQESMAILSGIKTPVSYTDPTATEKGVRQETAELEIAYSMKFVNLDKPIDKKNIPIGLKEYLEADNNLNKIDFVNRQVRTVDLIPRQSSLNVNDMKLRTRAGAFNFVLSTLFGFGSQLNVQRQREQFSQFVQQELYSSAFGKGSREFGWTFTPMPGMDRLHSGVRTTYAVVVVPTEATSLVLESNGCYFPRSESQPTNFGETKDVRRWGIGRTSRGCSEKSKAFLVNIPTATIDGSNDFWVDRIWYQPVRKGERIVVLISGKNFSSQIGVLVNGVPLIHSIGLAQPLMRDDSETGRLTAIDFKDVDISGRIERVDSNKIVFSFAMSPKFEGTPAITLVAPGKAIDLNWLTNIRINGLYPSTLSAASIGACPPPGCTGPAPDMFMPDKKAPLRIDSVEAFRTATGKANVVITGAGFDTAHKVFVNGVEIPGAVISKTLAVAKDIRVPVEDKIQVTIKAGEQTIQSSAAFNPMQLRIDKVTVVSYEPAADDTPGVLVVRIEGNGFSEGLTASPANVRVDVTSRTQAFLTITNPSQTQVVTLTDPVTNGSAKTVVARKPPA